jgi:hypothetical protein
MNKQWLLARTSPGGLPTDEDFKLTETPMPEPGPNQMLTRTIYLSLDPSQWGRKRSGLEEVGDVCHGRAVSQVVKSNAPEYLVSWQCLAVGVSEVHTGETLTPFPWAPGEVAVADRGSAHGQGMRAALQQGAARSVRLPPYRVGLRDARGVPWERCAGWTRQPTAPRRPLAVERGATGGQHAGRGWGPA